MAADFFDEARAALQAELTELTQLSLSSRAARAPVHLDQQSVGRLSRMDAMQQQSMDIAREERRRQRRDMIAAALRRLDEDEYGYCLFCGDDIAEGRLRADPAMTSCINCSA